MTGMVRIDCIYCLHLLAAARRRKVIEATVPDKVAKKVEELLEERFGDEDGLAFDAG